MTTVNQIIQFITAVLTVIVGWSCVWTIIYIMWSHRYQKVHPDWWQDPRWQKFERSSERFQAIAWFYLPKSLRP